MSKSMTAGAAYTALVFPCAFVIGAVRVLLVAPVTGPTVAVVLEAPLVLAIAWFACGWCLRRFVVGSALGARLTMGAVAFALLMLAEFALGAWMFGRSPAEQAAALFTLPGAIGLAAQIGFACLPLVRRPRL